MNSATSGAEKLVSTSGAAARPRAVRRPFEGLVVKHHDVAVGGGVHVELEPVRAGAQACGEGVERVFGEESGGAAVGEKPRTRAVPVARRLLQAGAGVRQRDGERMRRLGKRRE